MDYKTRILYSVAELEGVCAIVDRLAIVAGLLAATGNCTNCSGHMLQLAIDLSAASDKFAAAVKAEHNGGNSNANYV